MVWHSAIIDGRLFLISLMVIFFAIPDIETKTGPVHDKLVVCYLSSWAVYRPGRGSYSIDNFDPDICTHVIYSFAGLDPIQSHIKSLDPWQDLKDNYGKGGYERLTSLKSSHPHLKVTLAIGGWNEGSANYSKMADDPAARAKFAKQALAFVRKYNFDGLDLDWEYPTQRGGEAKDRANFVLLVKELHDHFSQHGLLLTSAIGASQNFIDKAYDIRQLVRYLDFLHIMCYDYFGNWDHKVGYNAPLTLPDDGTLSVQYSIDYLLKLGAPARKLVMGVPFYGRTYRTVLEGNLDDATDDVAFQGPYTREDGFLGYNEICQLLANKTSGWTTIWDPKTSQVLSRSERNPETGLVQVICYDSSRSIANKVKFAVEKKLAGIMIWSIDTDDFQGDCEIEKDIYDDYTYIKKSALHLPHRNNNKYPLLRTINEAISLAMEELKQQQDEAANQIPNDLDNEIPHGSHEHSTSRSAANAIVTNQGYLTKTFVQLMLFVSLIAINPF